MSDTTYITEQLNALACHARGVHGVSYKREGGEPGMQNHVNDVYCSLLFMATPQAILQH